MKKMKATLFLVICSLILTACSGGSGSGSMGEPNSSSFSANGEKRVKLPRPNSIIVDLSSVEGMQKLYEDARKTTAPQLNGTCTASRDCSRELPVNTLLGSYNQSYSSYAAIRTAEIMENEDNTAESNTTPVNSFVALVGLPTTDKNMVIDASYTGRISYSSKNNGGIVTRDSLTMTVKDNHISGRVIDETGSGTQRSRITFESTEIKAEPHQISFAGDATFHREVFLDMGNSKNPEYEGDIKGRYQGIFAGDKAQEVVGTFYSNNNIKNYSIQGAFAAQRVEK